MCDFVVIPRQTHGSPSFLSLENQRKNLTNSASLENSKTNDIKSPTGSVRLPHGGHFFVFLFEMKNDTKSSTGSVLLLHGG